MAMDRRRFLGLTTGLAAAGVIGVRPSSAAASAATVGKTQSRFGPPSERTLLVIELEGGNDALNTLVPATGLYHDLRPRIGLSDDDLTTFRGLDYGVNPALAGLEPLWTKGQLAAIYGAGLPDQSRSHFVAQDAWRSAMPGAPATSGWLGRWLESTEPETEIPLRAISLGRSTLAAQGETGRPVAVQSVEGYRLSPPDGNADVTSAMLSMASPLEVGLFGQAQAAIPNTVASVDELQRLISSAETTVEDYEPDPTSALFAAAQAIIQADVGTQVLYITVGGFDTHAGQRQRQDLLLKTVADGVSSLFGALDETGHADRTLAIAVTEFGRRAAENASAGTDHGKGGLSFVLGPAVAESSVVGEADLGDLDDGDVRVNFDARTIYNNALRWLDASDDVASQVLGGEFESMNLLHQLN